MTEIASARAALAVVRRPTGGRAILHHREITYSVTAPAAAAGTERESYAAHQPAARSRRLNNLGVDARRRASGSGLACPDATPCFELPAAGELTFEGRKLAGSAQWRIRRRSAPARLDPGGRRSDAARRFQLVAQTALPPPATLIDALGRAPSLDEAAAAFAVAVRELEDPHAAAMEIDEELRARASALVVRYSDDSWTWRR